jgi:hypothetical protein
MIRKSNRTIALWVDEDFKNQIKSQSALKGLSILEYSRILAKKMQEDEEQDEKKFRFPF